LLYYNLNKNMSTIIVSTEILGNAATDVLRREINTICLDEGIDGGEVWEKVSGAKSLDGIKDVLKDYFKDSLKIV
jgi:hypothetical protein